MQGLKSNLKLLLSVSPSEISSPGVPFKSQRQKDPMLKQARFSLMSSGLAKAFANTNSTSLNPLPLGLFRIHGLKV